MFLFHKMVKNVAGMLLEHHRDKYGCLDNIETHLVPRGPTDRCRNFYRRFGCRRLKEPKLIRSGVENGPPGVTNTPLGSKTSPNITMELLHRPHHEAKSRGGRKHQPKSIGRAPRICGFTQLKLIPFWGTELRKMLPKTSKTIFL